MSVHDDLGIRMKEFYENIPKTKLVRRVPVAIRIDGKAFHTFCRGFDKPFDDLLIKTMQETALYLCKNIQGCVFGYTQSDEITLILIDYQKLTSSAFFDYKVQKLCSITASMATMAFNKYFLENVEQLKLNSKVLYKNDFETDSEFIERCTEIRNLIRAYDKAVTHGALFDSRCFNIPKEEVCNLIYWRQVDATRNSIQMVGQANFSQKQLNKKSCDKIQDMLFTQKNINWNDFPIYKKRGTALYKKLVYNSRGENISDIACEARENEHYEWVIDKEMPILKGNDRNYVEKHVFIGEV